MENNNQPENNFFSAGEKFTTEQLMDQQNGADGNVIINEPPQPDGNTNPPVEPTVQHNEPPAAQPDEIDFNTIYNETEFAKQKKADADKAIMDAKLKEIEEFESSEVSKIWKRAKEAGKNFNDVYKEFVNQDIAKMTPEDLFKSELGAISGLTDEQKEEAIEDFNNMKPYEQVMKTNHIREALAAKQKESLSKLNPISQKSEVSQGVLAEAERAINELRSTLLTYYKAGKVDGVDFTKERVAKIHDTALDLLQGASNVFVEGEKVNTERLLKAAMTIHLGSVIEKGKEASGKSAGLREAFQTKHNPSTVSPVSSKIPSAGGDKMLEAAKGLNFGKRPINN